MQAEQKVRQDGAVVDPAVVVGRKAGQAGANELTIHGQGSYAFPQIHPAAEIRRVDRIDLAAQEVG